MINKTLKLFLSAISLFSMVFIATSQVNAAPVKFNQVTQVVNAKPGQASNGNYTNLRLNNDPVNDPVNDPKNDPKKGESKTESPSPQQDRVITETRFEITEEEDCNCTPLEKKGGFPYWALLGLVAIPVAIIVTRDKDPTPTPTRSMIPTQTTTPPMQTPTDTPPPVPEPMTILLFGTGLAGIGLAARKRFGKGEEEEGEV